MRHILLSIPAMLLVFGCTAPEKPATASDSTTDTRPENAPAPLPSQDSPDDWRMGDSLMATMGNLQGKVVADLFAGDGYYTWKLLGAGARVLALDDDPANLVALKARKQAEHIGDDRLIIRATTPGVVGLLPNEADYALITREVSTLGDRPNWFAQLFSGIKPPTTIYVVNFHPGESPVGPPLNQRMSYETAQSELNTYGFTDVGVLYKKIPYRYITFARVAQDTPEQPGE